MLAAENVCAAWAAVTLRQDENAVKPIVASYWYAVQQILEPYVLDGLTLMAEGKASKALSLITLESWYDNDDRISVFTPFYGAEEDDREAAGQAMSDYLRRAYRQEGKNDDGQPSHGYHYNAPEIGIAMAYHQLMDVARTNFPPGMLSLYVDRFWSTVRGLEGRPRKVSLPDEVRRAIINPSALQRRLDRVHALAR